MRGEIRSDLHAVGARAESAGQLRSAASLLHTAGSGLLAAHSKEHGQAWTAPSGEPAESNRYVLLLC